MRRHSLRIIVITLALLGMSAQAQAHAFSTTPQEVYNYINFTLQASAQTKELLITAFKKGFAEGRMLPEKAMEFIVRVNTSGAELREEVLVTIARALLEGLPVEILINKVLEGLAKGASMKLIIKEIRNWKQTLIEVKALLEGKGIKPGVMPELTLIVMDAVITAIAVALEDYVREGGNLNDATGIYQRARLELQRDGRITPQVAGLVLGSLSPQELMSIALNIAKRWAQD